MIHLVLKPAETLPHQLASFEDYLHTHGLAVVAQWENKEEGKIKVAINAHTVGEMRRVDNFAAQHFGKLLVNCLWLY